MPGDWSTGYTQHHILLTAAANIVLIELADVSFFFFFPGHVGAPLPCSRVKLVDIPDMKYYAKDGKGEVS